MTVGGPLTITAATMSGVTTLTASTFDDVGVVGVQFLVDGATLGEEDTTSPYSIVWNTTTVPNGLHVLSARARDEAGNTQTAAPVTVIVQNDSSGPSTLVAAFGFDESGGTSADDSSATGNDATLMGATWAAGRYGAAVSISGTAYAEAPDVDALSPGIEATFAAWVYLTAAPTEPASIVNKWSEDSEDEYVFAVSTSRNPIFAWHTTGGSTYGTPAFNHVSDAAQVPLNTWTHVALVRNGATLTFYLDGTPSSSVNAADTNPFRNGTNSMRVGGQSRGGMKRTFPGRIDELRIYTRALTALELQADMNAPTSGVGDTVAPTLALTAPSNGATLAGAVVVSGTASDNVGVAGVQFKVDGANLGEEDTTSPYSVDWITVTVPNGLHTLTAVARDAAGNATTIPGRMVMVNNSIPAPAGVVAAYAFDEGGGSVAADSSPMRNPAKLSGAAGWDAGRFGSALATNGSGFATASNLSAITPGVSATFEAWVFLTGSPGEVASILNKWSQMSQGEYLFALDQNRRVFFAWKTTGAGDWGTQAFNQATGTAQVPVNTWTHVAVVRDGATLNFYVNGGLDRSVTAMDTNPFRNGQNSLRIGGQARGGADRYFPGRIDEVRLYTRALTAGELLTDMNGAISAAVAPKR